ncbi:hypothetical protein PUP68_28135 [Pseudomonas chlororaphis]|uniref:hypothetical protein n=1 Tax=Pseudomonas chlororaphis TaxID=587753 RepID=UPI00236806A8|nr:hypothetical protein [Pseudomonas chlororaphis]WDG82280.1 hypothetical protein PUP77_16725 [Pseudomonas chlororaphis]WDG84666.1 hypothetical protein PUP68_28135 [Pseudomonas chlororaphis]
MTIQKVPQQLLYLVYGDKEVYRHEAKFSILTALDQSKNADALVIRVMTDRPEDYRGWPVQVVPLSAQTLFEWQGDQGYYHRRKACAFAAGLELADKTLFVDTDTLFEADPRRLFERIAPGQYLIDEVEFRWSEVRARPQFVKLDRYLQASGHVVPKEQRLFNSGVCGLTAGDGPLMQASIALIDDWSAHIKDLHTLEQIALSFALGSQAVGESKSCIYHYFSDKAFFHAMQALFFQRHGEAFRPELLRRQREVPRRKPVPSLFQRSRIKFYLSRQNKDLQKVGRDLLYGSNCPVSPYIDACRHVWWDQGLRQIQRRGMSQLAPIRALAQGEWPSGWPRPRNRDVEKHLRSYLQRHLQPHGANPGAK